MLGRRLPMLRVTGQRIAAQIQHLQCDQRAERHQHGVIEQKVVGQVQFAQRV